MTTLQQKTIFITGSSRGIGRAMALRFAAEGANIVITGKTVKPQEKLPGTIYTVAEEVKERGGQALAIPLDVRDEHAIMTAVNKTVDYFGGIDVLINNASAIALHHSLELSLKHFDLLIAVNVRATFACSQACIPHLKLAKNPHILNLSPPLNMQEKWFKDHLVYTYSKYGMSVCTLGMAAEFKKDGIAINSLWPRTLIDTAAIRNHFPPELIAACRTPDIVADAAYLILTQDSRQVSGNFFIDENVLRDAGVKDFAAYSVNPRVAPYTDFFLD